MGKLKIDYPVLFSCLVLLVGFAAIQLSFRSADAAATASIPYVATTIFLLAMGFILTLYLNTAVAIAMDALVIVCIAWLNHGTPRYAAFLCLTVVVISFFLLRVKNDNRRLLQLQQEKERNLHNAMARLEKVGELKDEMLFIASHDLRTPVSIIRSNLASIRDGYAGKLNKEAMGYVDSAYHATERLRTLLEDMLESSSLEQKGTVSVKPLQLEALVRAIVEAHAQDAKSIKLSYPKMPYRTKLVLADERLLQRALENLILNAIKFTKSGSVTIAVEQRGTRVACAITDTGIGISTEEQEQLFAKFYRASNAVNSKTRGSGLGLYITKQIIQRLGGEIAFTSTVNKGSTFTIFLLGANE